MNDPITGLPAPGAAEAEPSGRVQLSSISEAIEAIGRGEVVIVVDDEDRENEGDFVMAADLVTPEAVNFMITYGRGWVCLPMTGERLDQLRIPSIHSVRPSPFETAFTASITLNEDASPGISANDRARTIARAMDPSARAEDFRMPGQVYPLRARPGGVLERAGHTEAAVDLARLAGRSAGGVICEVMNSDGTMARLDDLVPIARRFGLRIISIADLIAYRRRHVSTIRREAEAALSTDYGTFTALGYRSVHDGREHLALTYGRPEGQRDVLVRMHSECLTGDVFFSRRCDCGPQLRRALQIIAEAGAGVVVYLRGHEGRGIGLVNKLRAYSLQESGRDTLDANLDLGFKADPREYGIGAQILGDLGLSTLRLLTNNPRKRVALEGYGLTVVCRVPLEVPATHENAAYLATKRDRMGHLLAEPGRRADRNEDD